MMPALEAFEEMNAMPGDFATGLLVGTVANIDFIGGDKDYRWHLAHLKREAWPIVLQSLPLPVRLKPFS